MFRWDLCQYSEATILAWTTAERIGRRNRRRPRVSTSSEIPFDQWDGEPGFNYCQPWLSLKRKQNREKSRGRLRVGTSSEL
jgi:hypothetical protein